MKIIFTKEPRELKLTYRFIHVTGTVMSWRTKFAPTVRAINLTFPKSLKGHCWTAFIRKFSIIWRKSLPGFNLPLRPRPDGLSFTTTLRARVPAAFTSGGCSHCIQYLSGSFDILRQFAFEKLARREIRDGIETSKSRTQCYRQKLAYVVQLSYLYSTYSVTRNTVSWTHPGYGRIRYRGSHAHGRSLDYSEFAQCLSTNTLMKVPTKATRLLIKLAQNATPLRNDVDSRAQCTAWMLLN